MTHSWVPPRFSVNRVLLPWGVMPRTHLTHGYRLTFGYLDPSLTLPSDPRANVLG